MKRPFQLDEWVLLVSEHNGVAAGTSVRISRLYNSPRTVQVTSSPVGSERGEGVVFDVPSIKLARRSERGSLAGRLRTKVPGSGS